CIASTAARAGSSRSQSGASSSHTTRRSSNAAPPRRPTWRWCTGSHPNAATSATRSSPRRGAPSGSTRAANLRTPRIAGSGTAPRRRGSTSTSTPGASTRFASTWPPRAIPSSTTTCTVDPPNRIGPPTPARCSTPPVSPSIIARAAARRSTLRCPRASSKHGARSPPRPEAARMDNATHSLAGVFLAQCALGRQSEPERARLWLPFHLAGVLGSNLPDLDFVYTSLTEGKLGYLLHHRGHTHTAPIAVLLGVGLAGVLAWSLRRRGVPLRSRTAAWLYGLAGVATLLHIAMDFGNGYGVHPWWPFDNRWFYGDAIFI